MKKIISWGMMLAAAFTLTNCAKEIDAPVQEPESVGYPFEIVASTVDTKTVNDGMSTKWVADDQINLIHKESENPDASYVSEAAFSIASEDLVDGLFTGTLAKPLVSGNHDWYVLYPYSTFTKSPEKSGYLPIGCEPAKSQVQIQEGNGSMAHIAGPNYPLWGNVMGVAHDEKPDVKMSHVSSLIKVVVTNVTDTPLTVENIDFTAPVDIVGTYYINFAGEKVECTNSGENYVSKTATLKVNNGAAIEAGKPAEFYLAVRPFTAEAGTSLSLAVNGYSKKPKALTNDVTFHAGKIKTLNFAYDYVAPAGEQTVTFDFSEMGYANGDAVEQVQESPISIAWNKGSNNNAPKYYTTGEAIRAYAGNYFTISTTEGTIVKVEFTFATGEGSNAITVNSGSYSNNAWIGDNQAIKFTIEGTSGHRRIATIKVTYKSSDVETPEQPVEKTLSAIEVVDPVVDYEIDDDFVEPTVKAVYSDNSTAIVTGATFDGFNMSEAGTQTVTVSYTEGTTVTTTYDITVEAPVVDDTDYSGIYAIVAYRNSESKFYYMTNEETTSSTKRLVAVVAGTECPTDGITLNASKLWKIAKSGSTYMLQSVESGKYVSWSSDNSATMSDSGLEFNISKNDNGTYLLNNGERNLSLNNSTGSNYFAMYKNTMVDDLYLVEAVEGEEPAPILTGISVSGQTTTFNVGDTFNFNGVVTATYSDETSKTVTATSVSSPNMSVAGNPEVTVTYIEGEVTATAKYTITVEEKATEPEEPSSTPKFVKVTSAPSDWSGTYLIVYETGKVAFDGSRTTMDAVSNTISVTISNGEIAHTSNLEASTFVIAKSGSNYTVKSASGYYVGQTSNANGLKSSKTTSYNHTISMTGADVNLVSGGAYLRYNAASDQKRFRYYKSSSYTGQKSIQLYKLVN